MHSHGVLSSVDQSMCLVAVPLLRATVLARRPWWKMICRAQDISAFNTGFCSFSEDTFVGHGKINRTLTKSGGQMCGVSCSSSIRQWKIPACVQCPVQWA
jgi:hypothetical protein